MQVSKLSMSKIKLDTPTDFFIMIIRCL